MTNTASGSSALSNAPDQLMSYKVGDENHLKVFASIVAANAWFANTIRKASRSSELIGEGNTSEVGT